MSHSLNYEYYQDFFFNYFVYSINCITYYFLVFNSIINTHDVGFYILIVPTLTDEI